MTYHFYKLTSSLKLSCRVWKRGWCHFQQQIKGNTIPINSYFYLTGFGHGFESRDAPDLLEIR